MSLNRFFAFLYKHPLTFSYGVFLLIFVITQFLAFQQYNINLSKIEKENTKELNRVVDQLQFNLNYALSTTKTLSFIVENYGIPQDFDSIAKKLLEANDLVDAIQLLEKGVITKMYPLEGNEMVLGYNVVQDPQRGQEVLMALIKGSMYFGGPFELKQGGLGVVGRMPLNVENDSLCFSAVVIKLDELLQSSGISNNSDRFYYQLSKVNPDTNQKEYFIETNQDFSKSQVAQMVVPQGEWQVYVKEKQANYLENAIAISILGILLSILGGYLTKSILKKPAELEKQVRLQTEIILGKDKRYRALVEKSADAVLILDKKGRPIFVSPSIVSVLGFSENEAYKMNMFTTLHPEDVKHVVNLWEDIINQPGIPVNCKPTRIKHKDGTWRWIDATFTNLLDDPNVRGIVNNFRDITEKKQTEEIIVKEKELFEAVINSLPGIFYLFNQKGEFLLWNDNFQKVSEYSAEEIKTMHPLDFFDGTDKQHIKERITEAFETGESFAEAYFTSKSGKKVYHYFTGSLVNYKNEICLLGTGIDTSKRREAEMELKKSEEQMLSVFNNSISAVIMIDDEGLITNWNQKAEEIFGWKEEEVLQKPMHQFIMPEEHLQRHLEGMQTYRKTGKGPIINSNFEIDAITKSNEKIDITLGVTTVRIKGKQFFIGFINDITARKEQERIINFENQNRDALINSTDDFIWSVSNELTLISANDAFRASFKEQTNEHIQVGNQVLYPKLDEDYLNIWKNLYLRALKGEKFTEIIHLPESLTQENRIVETKFSPIINNGNIEGVACLSRNITERFKIQEEIKEYNEKLKTAQEIAQLGYWEYNPIDSTLFWTDQIYSIWEEDPSIFSPTVKSFQDSIHPDDRDKFYMFKNQPVPENYTQDIQYRIITKNGNLKWIYQFGKTFNGGRNNSKLFKGIMRDITESKIQQQTIVDYNLKLKTAQEIAQLGYWEYDIKNKTITRSHQARVILGIPDTENDFTQADFLNLIHPDDRERFEEHHKLNLKGLKTLDIEYRIVLQNGKIKWLQDKGEIVFDKNGNPETLKGTVQDITTQKEIELELREQNDFIKTAIENLPVGIAIRNIDTGKFTLMNKNFTEIYGWSKKELKNVDGFFEKVYPDTVYRKKIKNQIFSDLASKDVKRMQWEGLQSTTKKGEKRIINAKNIPLYDQKLMISSVVDVTEKTLAEEELAKSNERYEYVTKATFDTIWDWDLVKNTIFWGEGFKTTFGIKDVESTDELWFNHIHPEDIERIKNSIWDAIKGNDLNWQEEYRFKHVSGTYHYVKDRGIILRNVERKAIRMIGAIQDITPQKEYEQQLLAVNQKLDKHVRELAVSNQELQQFAYIASHDMQEPLRMVISFLSLLEKKYKEVLDEKGIQYITFAVDGAERMRQLILDVLEFSRAGRVEELKQVDTNKILETVVQLNKELIEESGANVSWKELPVINSTETGLHQLFHNLINNAIKYRRKDVNPVIEIKAEEKKDYWQFSVSDNGIGIHKDFYEKIFNIFQRLHNKEDFEGTGIGLAICKKIVELLDGKIWVESVPGTGSTFYFTLKKQ